MKFKKVELQAFRAYEDKKDGTFDFLLPDGECANFIFRRLLQATG